MNKTNKNERSNSSNSLPKSYLSILKYLPVEELGMEKSFNFKEVSINEQKLFAPQFGNSEIHNEEIFPYDDVSVISRVKKHLKKEDYDFLMSLKNLPIEEVNFENPFKVSSNRLHNSEASNAAPPVDTMLKTYNHPTSHSKPAKNINFRNLDKSLLGSFKQEEILSQIINK